MLNTSKRRKSFLHFERRTDGSRLITHLQLEATTALKPPPRNVLPPGEHNGVSVYAHTPNFNGMVKLIILDDPESAAESVRYQDLIPSFFKLLRKISSKYMYVTTLVTARVILHKSYKRTDAKHCLLLLVGRSVSGKMFYFTCSVQRAAVQWTSASGLIRKAALRSSGNRSTKCGHQ